MSNPDLEARFREANAEVGSHHRALEAAIPERDGIAWQLYEQFGYTQREIANLANETAHPRLTEDAFQKAFTRFDRTPAMA